MKIQNSLIEVNDLVKLVNLAILTGKLKNEKPVLILLVGDTETGKTKILDDFMNPLFSMYYGAQLLARVLYRTKINIRKIFFYIGFT